MLKVIYVVCCPKSKYTLLLSLIVFSLKRFSEYDKCSKFSLINYIKTVNISNKKTIRDDYDYIFFHSDSKFAKYIL